MMAAYTTSRRSKMKWITREKVKVDRVACPWLIRKFVDKDAEFVFVPGEKVMAEAKRLDAIPYDVKDVERCTINQRARASKLSPKAFGISASRTTTNKMQPSGSSTTRSMRIAARW
jgi:hypothetical protein